MDKLRRSARRARQRGWHGHVRAVLFYGPAGIAVDSSGNIYVADKYNYTIRKITPAGMVTTLAGSAGNYGSADGTGSDARFYDPTSVAVDGSGNVYVADSGNHTIRKITPAGVVTTLAGTAGTGGSTDGTGSAARFRSPRGTAVDGSGNVIVADDYNDTIRKITPAGVVTTLAGSAGIRGSADGTGSDARFDSPEGVAVDGSENVYVADSANSTIRMITPAGVVTMIGGAAGVFGGADGVGTAAQFMVPLGIAVSSTGALFVADSSNRIALGQTVPPGTIASLRSLVLSTGALSPRLSPTTWLYGASVSSGTTSITVTPTVEQAGATVKVSNVPVASGTASGPISLIVGSNIISIVVTSQGGIFTENYVVMVTRLAIPPVKAQITSPANGSALTSTQLPLVWDTGAGVSGYALWAGTAAGGYDVYAALEAGTSRTISVPAGKRIHVTLWSLINGSFQGNHYVFDPVPSSRAALTTPADGSTLASGTLALNWNAGVGASSYALWLGSSPGGYDLGAASAGTATGWTFSNVPQDGGPVYLTLWSLINGAWQSNSYWFTTALPVSGNRAAVLSSPANATALGSATLNLTWDAGVGTSGYALWVGSTPNGYDLYAALETGTSRSVAVPADGRRIYVTLWTLIGGSYQSNAYYFTAPTLPDAGAAQVTSPAIGSTLSDSTLPLTWSSAAGATQYYLFVGSSPGAYDLYIGSQGTSLSRTVTGMPLDGRPVYVTLYSWLNNTWKPSSTWFTTANTAAGNKRALMTGPANATTLPGASTTFSWGGGVGVTQYALWIGSSPAAYDLWASAEGLATSRTVNTLPTDGRKLYVTLYSYLAGVWQAASYQYTAANVAITKATIASPTPGSTLPGSSATLTWTASNSATAYALWIGRTPGGYDVYAGYEGASLSRTVSTLPVDGGPVYVTLWSLIKGAWQSTEAIYQTATP